MISVSLGCPSGFGSVRHIYFFSLFKVALSEYLHCLQAPTCPWNHCLCFYSPVRPCTAGRSLPGKDLCGSFLSSPTKSSALWKIVSASLSLLSLPSMSWGLCALVFAHRASLYFVRLMCTYFVSQSAHYVVGFVCSYFSSSANLLCHGASRGFSPLPEHAIWLGPQSVNCLQAENSSFSLLCPPSSCFVWFSKTPQLPHGSA